MGIFTVKINKSSIFLFFFLFSGIAFGQYEYSFPKTQADFINELFSGAEETGENQAASLYIDSLKSIIYSSTKERELKIDTLFNYDIICINKYVSDSEKIDLGNLKSGLHRFIYNKPKVYTGKELFNGLEIDNKFLNSHDYYSVIDLYNSSSYLNKWFPYNYDDYLLLEYTKVDYYSRGNFRRVEYVLIFKKTEKHSKNEI